MSVDTVPASQETSLAIRRSLKLAGLVLAGLVVGLGGLSAIIGINGAVIAPGQVSVSSEVKKVQHPTGGVIAEIRVRNGSQVKAGDVMLALDPTAASANVAIVGSAVDSLFARQARLEAERDGRPLRFPPELANRRSEPAVAALMADESRLYALRLSERAGQKSQLRERQAQLREEISGYADATAAKQQQIELIQQELVGVRQLYDQRLVPLTRLNTLERSAVQLRGDIAQLAAASAESKGKIAEIGVQLLQVDQSSRSEAGAQLSQVQGQLAELRQRKVTADVDYGRVLVRAPQGGVVDRLNVHTIGGVIAPGEPILYIVPDKDDLAVEARIRPTDVDQVKVGQPAALHLSAFNVRSTPELKGSVQRVSAEAHVDERTGVSYYTASISIPKDQLARLGPLKLTPGMPVESFIQTERRTMLSYLVRPFMDQLRRAFRED